jgi:general stress protein YciG
MSVQISLHLFVLSFNSGKERKMQGNKGRGRGFASMSPEKKREIASKGGKAAHQMGTAHKWTSEEAQAAGRKGGSISRRRPKNAAQA